MKTVWVLDHYARPRHQQFAQLNRHRYRTIRFMSAFINKQPELGRNKTRVEQTDYGQVVHLRTFSYDANNWRRSLNMVSFAVQVVMRAFRRPRPDVVVASGPHLFTLAAGMVVAWLRRAHLVVEVRDFWPRSLVDLNALRPAALSTRLLYRLERWSYAAADGIIFSMPKGNLYLHELGLDKETCVIPNGVARALAEDTSVVPVELAGNYPFVAMYSGLLGVANNVDIILEAAAILSIKHPGRFGFLLYGYGQEKERLTQRARQMDNVHMMDPVPHQQLLAILRGNADATLFTLRSVDVFKYGVSPNKIADYLAAAKPLVFSCNAGNDVAVLAGCGISVPPDDPEALAEALVQLAEMPQQQRQEMGQRGYKYLLENYILEDHARLFGDFVLSQGS